MTCVVLCWHRVLRDGVGGIIGDCHRVRGTVVSVANFERQIADVTRYFTPVTLGQFVAALEGGSALPPRACLITFDDGYVDFAEHALPVLERWSLPSVLFVTVEQARSPRALMPTDVWYATLENAKLPVSELKNWILGPEKREYDYAPPELQPALLGRLADTLGAAPPETESALPLYLNEAELRRLAARGVALGGHGAVHHALAALPDDAITANLNGCRAWLQRITPGQPATLAYPYGRTDERVARAAASRGFRAAFGVRPYDGTPDADRFALKRSCVPDCPAAIEDLINGVVLKI